MSASAPPAAGGRTAVLRANAGVGLVVNLGLALLVNTWPGWQAVPFLTPSFADVLPWVNLSLVLGAAVDFLVMVTGSTALKAVGDGAVALAGCWSILRLWEVFPFDLTPGWQAVVRVALGLGVLGSIVGFVGSVAALLRIGTSRRAGR
jgi:hypothetical protein